MTGTPWFLEQKNGDMRWYDDIHVWILFWITLTWFLTNDQEIEKWTSTFWNTRIQWSKVRSINGMNMAANCCYMFLFSLEWMGHLAIVACVTSYLGRCCMRWVPLERPTQEPVGAFETTLLVTAQASYNLSQNRVLAITPGPNDPPDLQSVTSYQIWSYDS